MDQNITKFHVNVRIKKMVGLRSQSAECLATVQDFRSRVSIAGLLAIDSREN